jgi:hypothetical protein
MGEKRSSRKGRKGDQCNRNLMGDSQSKEENQLLDNE